MNKIKKIPQGLSLVASTIIIFVSIIGGASLNILAYRVIIFALIFYFIGLLIKYFIETTYNPELYESIETIEEDKQINDNKANIEIDEEFIPLNEHNINGAEEK
jgi:hypothetical protein